MRAVPAYHSGMGESKVRMARVLRNGARDDGSFDVEFWRRVGAEGRFAAAWEMVCEADAIRGVQNAREPRLQRSVLRIERR
jgi:hypothetical protein